MKKLLLLFFTFIPILSFSQNWADFNSMWHYNQINFFTPPNLAYIKFEAIGDTLINGDTVKIILEENLSLTDTTSANIFMKSDSGKVYLYVPEISSYKLIYDFTANTGDTIEVFCRQANQDSVIKVHVDSISTININDNTLKVQHVSQIRSEGDEYYMEGEIIENIGWTGFMFPLHAWADPPYGGSLRCFQNDKIGLYKLTETDCDYITSNKIINKRNEIKIYPNPTTGKINILSEKIESIEIRDINGKIVYSGNEKLIDLSYKKQGLYFVIVVTNNEIHYGKLVVQ